MSRLFVKETGIHRYLFMIALFMLSVLLSNGQTPESFQVEIISNTANNRFCSGTAKTFQLEARTNGGQEPYFYEWTFSWNNNTLDQRVIEIIPNTTGEVTLRVRDSSNPENIAEVKYHIQEIILDADFSFNPGSSCSGEPVSFTSTVSGGTPAYTYLWNFSDGQTSNQRNPVHQFSASGCGGPANFNVQMEVTDADGCRANVTKTVSVLRKPVLDFTDAENPFNPFRYCPEVIIDPTFQVTLANLSWDVSCISSYSVNWGDGHTRNNATFPVSHTYTKAGAFLLMVRAVTVSGCHVEWSTHVYIQSSPAAGIESFGGTEGCSPIQFEYRLVGYENNSIGTTYTWRFGDNSAPIVWDHNQPYINNIISHNYERSSCDFIYGPGYFNTSVTVTNGCDTKTATVDRIRIYTKPQSLISNNESLRDTICTNEAFHLSNNTILGYYGPTCTRMTLFKWDFGDGTTWEQAEMPTISYSTPGTYDIVLSSSNPCGVSTDTVTLVVIDPPVAEISADQYEGCVPFIPRLENNSINGDRYRWVITPDSGYTFINGTNERSHEPEISFNQRGSYQLTMHVSNSCNSDSAVITFNVFSIPDGIITNLHDVCISDPVINPSVVYNDNGKPVNSFVWTFPGGSPATASGQDPGEHRYASAGRHTVNLTLRNECGDYHVTDSFFIQPLPEFTLNTPLNICETDHVIIQGTEISNRTSFVWQTAGDGYFNNSSLLNPLYYPGNSDRNNEGTDLRIVAKGIDPCGFDTAVIRLNLQKEPLVMVDNNVTICEGAPYTIKNASADYNGPILWATTGDGHFSDPGILLPVYYPGNEDISNGHVELTLTAESVWPCLSETSASFVITYAKTPYINAGPDRDICEEGQSSLSAAGTGFTSVNWKIESGQGIFNDPTILNPNFMLGPGSNYQDIILIVEAIGDHGCPNVQDTLMLSVIPKPIVVTGEDVNICQNATHQISGASVQEYKNYFWTVNGDGTLDDSTRINPVYTPGLTDITNGRVTLTLKAEGNSVCPDVSDNITIHIQPLPEADAGDDQNVCKTNTNNLTGNQVNGSTIQWISQGTGTFQNTGSLLTTYYPSQTDLDHGRVDLVLRVNALAPCTAPAFDTVRLTFIDPPVVFAGNDTIICSAPFSPVNAYTFNSTQFTWSSSGVGTWLDQNTLKPVYFPSSADVTNGMVNLTLTSLNPSCPPVSSSMRLELKPPPFSYAGADDIICEDKPKTLDDSRAENTLSIEWKTSGDGHFDDKNNLHPSYYPGLSDIDNGSVKLFLITSAIPPCHSPLEDSLVLSIQKNPGVYTGADTIIGEGDQYTAIHAEIHNVNQVRWRSLGDGTFIDENTTYATYIPGTNDLLSKGVKLVIEGTSFSPCVKVATDTIFVSIVPKPLVNAGPDLSICEGSHIPISNAFADEYSQIWWTSTGSGVLEDSLSLTPVYHPSMLDIANRTVFLTLHARGNHPLEHAVASDQMQINIVHNTSADLFKSDTACVNLPYLVSNIMYRDVNTISWSSSGDGNFNGTGEENPVYSFSSNDNNKDTVYFYLELTSLSPCTHIHHDTLMIRLFHEPIPSFEMDAPEGCAPLSVNFTNTSEGEDMHYYWEFGNGLVSSEIDPREIEFSQGRTADTIYTITLQATNRCGSHHTTKPVLVKPKPIADFGMDVSWGCSPKEINFFNVTTGLAESYLWNWGDGKAPSIQKQPGSHIFETGEYDTTYTITLFAENECGMDSTQKSVIIFPNSVNAFFETDTVMGCAPLKVSFRNYSRGVLGNQPFLNWSWNFGDGNITDQLHPVHTFRNPGLYKVTLFVNDTCSFDSFTTEIHVMGGPEVDFITDKNEYCVHDTVFLTPVNMPLERIAGVVWDYGDSIQGFNFHDQHIYQTDGLFNITLTAKDITNGCLASTSKPVTVHPVPVSNFSIPDNDGCQPLPLTFLNESTGGNYFSWDFGNGNLSIEQNGSQLFTEPGNYIITLRVSNLYGCSAIQQKKLDVNPRPVSAFSSSSLVSCFPPEEVEFYNLSEGANDYQWNLGNGTLSKVTNPRTTYMDYGDYPVQLIATNMFFCSDTSDMVYHVYHNPVADFKTDTTIGCDPFTVPFVNLSEYGLEYYWEFGEKGYSEEEEPVFTFHGEGTYTVSLRVTGLGGCNDIITQENFIITNPSPSSDFGYTRLNNDIDTVQFHNYSTGAISFIWNFGDGKSSEEENPWHSYQRYGTYNVSLTTMNEYNCKNTKVESIQLLLTKGLFLPNAFSPDNLSEEVREFKAIGTGLLSYHLVIYDTWGNLIWETTKLDYQGRPVEAWDGTFQGKPLPPDVYVWHLKEAIFKDGDSFDGKRYGSITLIK